MKAVFSEIYRSNAWIYGSGEGSLPIHTKGYMRFIERFIQSNRIDSVVDYGCGDWQFSKYIEWGKTNYLGLDIVESLIDHNTKVYSSDNVSFALINPHDAVLPQADLLIIKDVLQHWSNQSILSFVSRLTRYRFVLITNCVNPMGETNNGDIEDGGFRYLDLTKPPFSRTLEKVYEFTNYKGWRGYFSKPRWRKAVFLQRSS